MRKSDDFEKALIGDLVSENYVFASVLHYFGISFYQYSSHSLEVVCKKHKVHSSQLITELESWAQRTEPTNEELFLNPIEVLVAYLKKKHYYFVRQELPFLSNIISGINPEPQFASLMADLRIMFPLFVEDFIHHIHEEESRLFKRIELLQDIENNRFSLQDAMTIIERDPIQLLADQHEIHDDEMEGIRKLTMDYTLDQSAPLTMKVLYHELQDFEKELKIHAKIEDDLLFPKAVELEREVLRQIKKKIQRN
ncbi:hemerythrin domain-containing protein [Algoriphagus halophytocola]|uniref:Hemerythrin domain-containing protein n=1 Tax=Algoriphagus halophytocola TaxID=2991499 RepID=A0ABY6MFM6_9BACT|nr:MULTISPECIES: hemerythrin domain-containing protein [unclassified Algoriphagus]UZD22234.1 hemerythrin domain-containing protein [Algoriphagus sp. TR-M5]WBL43482.1 hemerythrin domain-containing protein [Algoriphagus sp. TR-M9]